MWAKLDLEPQDLKGPKATSKRQTANELRNNRYKPFLMFNCEICFTLITRRRAKALAEQGASAVGGLPEPPNSLRDASPPREKKTLFLSLRSLILLVPERGHPLLHLKNSDS